MGTTLRIATRKSPLALWQAQHVADALVARHHGLECELVPMRSEGDALLDAPLAKVGGKGLFVKELERALIDGRADIAVHSMKDVPVALPPGLVIPVFMSRADPRDALVGRGISALESLPRGARIGTSSLRRQCQLKAWRSDLQLVNLRGGVDTRLAKLDAGDFDAIILAAAGLDRMQLQSRIVERVSPKVLLPAVGQGVMGIECRGDDASTIARIAVLADAQATITTRAERALNAALDGGCQVPIAAHAVVEGERVQLQARVVSLDGAQCIEACDWDVIGEAQQLGSRVAKQLLSNGAKAILDDVYAHGG